jgi:hypothetical protein
MLVRAHCAIIPSYHTCRARTNPLAHAHVRSMASALRRVLVWAMYARTVSRAAAAIVAACAEAYLLGASDTNGCPPRSSKIDTEAACESAAAAVGMTYDLSGSFGNSPSGCLFNFAAHPYRVIFNTAVPGAAADFTQPLCAGARRPDPTRRAPAHSLRVSVSVCTCMSCACVCVHACMCVHMHVRMYVGTRVRIYLNVCTSVHRCIYIHV